MGDLPLRVEAVYENGVLRPLQPLDLREHERVIVSVSEATSIRSGLAVEYMERIKKEVQAEQAAPGVEEVQRRLAKIPHSMSAEIISERGER